MADKLTFRYDRVGDILFIETRPPYTEQESRHLDDDIVARLNPTTGEVETIEVLFFSARLMRRELFEVPVRAEMHLAE